MYSIYNYPGFLKLHQSRKDKAEEEVLAEDPEDVLAEDPEEVLAEEEGK